MDFDDTDLWDEIDNYQPDVESDTEPEETNYDRAYREAWQVFRVPEPMTFPEWADKNFWLSQGSSGMPGQWTTYDYQKAIMHAMSDDAIRTVRWQKPARFGYTKIITAYIGYCVERRKRNVALWQPTDPDAHEYVQDEIDPMLDDCPSVGAALVVTPGKKDPSNTMSRKVFKGATLHIKGGNVAAKYRRITVDSAIIDELDGFDHVIKGSDAKEEGTAPDLAWIRVTDSVFKKLILGSTPTVAGASQIEAKVEECEHVFERYVPCKHCSTYQTLKWGGFDCDFGIKWVGNTHKTAYYVCESCHKPSEYSDRDWMDANGYWMSETLYIDDETGDYFYIHNDKPAEKPEDVAFNCDSLISPLITWAETTKEFIDAAKKVKLGELSAMMTWVNTRMGNTFEMFSVEKYDPTTFLARREPYPVDCDAPLQVVAMTAAVDVQIDRLEILFIGWGRGEESFAIKKVAIYGDTSETLLIDENGVRLDGAPETIWCKLDVLLRTRFKHESGQQLSAQIVCLDSGYMTEQVYKFCRRNPTTYIPVKGSGEGQSHPIVVFPKQRNTTGVFLTMVGSDNCQDTLNIRYDIQADGPGKCHWPDRDDEFGLDFFAQMVAEIRVARMRKGRKVLTWICPPNVRNENADLYKYNLAAVKLMQDYKFVNLNYPIVATTDTIEDDDEFEGLSIAEMADRLNRPRSERRNHDGP